MVLATFFFQIYFWIVLKQEMFFLSYPLAFFWLESYLYLMQQLMTLHQHRGQIFLLRSLKNN